MATTADALDGIRDSRDHGPSPGQVVTTMDGTPSGPVVQHGAEVSEAAPVAPAPAPAAPATEPPPDEKTLAKMIANKRYRDDSRSAIFERRNAMSLEERQQLESLDAESASILEAQAGMPRGATVSTAPLAPREPAAPVAQTPTAPAAPMAAPVADPAAPSAQQPVASNSRSYKLSVYGQEQVVAEDQVIQAGIQALQKQHAADARMRDAATYEARVSAWANEVQRWADDKARELTSREQARPGTAGGAAPTTPGVAAVVDQATLRQAMEALENLDSAKATELMQKAINDAVTKGLAVSTPAPVQAAPSPATGGVPRLQPAASDPWSTDQRAAANRVFNSEFAHFTDAQFSAAQAAVADAMDDPSNVGKDLATIVRTVCRTTQRFMPASSTPAPMPAAPANPTQEELEGRRVLKARIPVTPPAASMRAASSAAPEVRYPSGSEYVQQLRRRSGSNSSR